MDEKYVIFINCTFINFRGWNGDRGCERMRRRARRTGVMKGGVRNRGRFARLVWNAVHHCRFTEVHACAYIRMYYRGWLHREYGSARAGVRPYKRTRCMSEAVCVRRCVCACYVRVCVMWCVSLCMYMQPPCNPRAILVHRCAYIRIHARARVHSLMHRCAPCACRDLTRYWQRCICREMHSGRWRAVK